MKETLYLSISRNIQVKTRDVKLADVADMYCKDKAVVARLKTEKLIKLPDVKRRRVVFETLRVVEMIQNVYPDLDIVSIGENDFIVDYIKQRHHPKILTFILVAAVSLLVFFGSMYAIIAYNNDVDTPGIFEKVYEQCQADDFKESHALEIAYSVGLALGIIVFYNHFAGRKLTGDPTPLQVEMNKYEKDLNDAVVDRSDADDREETP